MLRAFLISFLLCCSVTTVSAESFDSIYTKIKPGNCPVVDRNADEGWSVWKCPGISGIPVHVAVGDERYFVSFGRKGAKEYAASQTFAFFNDINDTLEWRRVKVFGKYRAFSTILRWFIDDPNNTGKQTQVLVVSRLGQDKTCHVAYVDASANRNANTLARKAADDMARDFQCGADKVQTLGKVGAVLKESMQLR